MIYFPEDDKINCLSIKFPVFKLKYFLVRIPGYIFLVGLNNINIIIIKVVITIKWLGEVSMSKDVKELNIIYNIILFSVKRAFISFVV